MIHHMSGCRRVPGSLQAMPSRDLSWKESDWQSPIMRDLIAGLSHEAFAVAHTCGPASMVRCNCGDHVNLSKKHANLRRDQLQSSSIFRRKHGGASWFRRRAFILSLNKISRDLTRDPCLRPNKVSWDLR